MPRDPRARMRISQFEVHTFWCRARIRESSIGRRCLSGTGRFPRTATLTRQTTKCRLRGAHAHGDQGTEDKVRLTRPAFGPNCLKFPADHATYGPVQYDSSWYARISVP